jgi:hypothetical protein
MATLAKKLTTVEERLLETDGLLWSESVPEAAIPPSLEEIMKVESVLQAIKAGTRNAGDGRVIIPGNLERDFLYLSQRMQAAAFISGSELLRDETQKVSLSYSEVWSLNAQIREDAIKALQVPTRAKELEAIANLAVLIESLGQIPSPENLVVSGPGKKGIVYILLTVAGIYCEQQWNVPLATTKKWWKIQGDIRSDLESDIAAVVGGTSVARTIINAINILYRRYLRLALHQKVDKAKNDTLKAYLQSIMHRVACNGAALFGRFLREETFTTEKKVPDPSKKGAATKTERVQTTGLVRPKLLTGPVSQLEEAVLARINSSLSTIESNLEEKVGLKNFDSPTEWATRIQSWVDDLYTRTNVVSKQIAMRKQRLRQAIIARRMQGGVQAQGKAALPQQFAQGISPIEWQSEVERELSVHQAKWESETLNSLKITMRGYPLSSLEEVLTMSEDAIKGIFRQQIL